MHRREIRFLEGKIPRLSNLQTVERLNPINCLSSGNLKIFFIHQLNLVSLKSFAKIFYFFDEIFLSIYQRIRAEKNLYEALSEIGQQVVAQLPQGSGQCFKPASYSFVFY